MKKYYEENYIDLVRRYHRRKLWYLLGLAPACFFLGFLTACAWLLVATV